MRYWNKFTYSINMIGIMVFNGWRVMYQLLYAYIFDRYNIRSIRIDNSQMFAYVNTERKVCIRTYANKSFCSSGQWNLIRKVAFGIEMKILAGRWTLEQWDIFWMIEEWPSLCGSCICEESVKQIRLYVDTHTHAYKRVLACASFYLDTYSTKLFTVCVALLEYRTLYNNDFIYTLKSKVILYS